MQCLNCRIEMTNYQVVTQQADISYNACEKCGSLWLDAGELDKMAFQVEGDIEYCSQERADGAPEEVRKKCPRCDDSVLDRVKFLGCDDIFLHRCSNCGGFWLDGGQLNLVDQELATIMPVSGRGFSDFVNNVHVPYWFQRISRKSSETDYKVAVLPIKGAELKEPTTDKCPACGATLNLYEIFSMLFEGCPHCKGIWLFKDELRRLKNKVEHGSMRWLNEEIDAIGKASLISTQRACVKCKTVNMVSTLFGKSSIVIDWCPQCHGMWLERGEFESIVNYLKEELAKSSREIQKIALDETKKIWTGAPEGRPNEIRDAYAAMLALVNATIMEHPTLRFLAQARIF
jgi:Zn-finger nucleic acid-binding protein